MGSMISIILSSLASLSVTIWLWFLTHQLRKQRDQLLEHKRRLNLADKDIKTLHFNQRVLQSLVKEMRRDLLLYGEIKKSRNKTFPVEKPEES